LTISDANRLLVSALLNKLLNQPAATAESSSSIKILHDVTRECLLSLRNLQVNVENWDPLLLHILIRKLDNNTNTLYEQGLEQPRSLQSLEEFLIFLEKRFHQLEALSSKGHKGSTYVQAFGKRTSPRSLSVVSARTPCLACKGDHSLPACNTFLKMTPEKRLKFIQRAGRCVNCLRVDHLSSHCPSGTCKKCSRRHNHSIAP